WLKYQTGHHGPLALKSALWVRNRKLYNWEKSRQWILDDAWWLATQLSIDKSWPTPPPKPATLTRIVDLRQQLTVLREWIERQEGEARHKRGRSRRGRKRAAKHARDDE